MIRRPFAAVPVAVLAVVALATAACSSDISTSPSSTPDTGDGTLVPSSGGWIGGEPDWDAAADGRSGGDGTMSPAAEDALPLATAPGGGDSGGPSLDPLRAGSVDDNADFAAYLEYAARIRDLGIETRAFDATGRVVVSVVGSDGLPVAGAQVTVTTADRTIAQLRTTADGTTRFLPALYGAGGVTDLVFTAEEGSAAATPGTDVTITLGRPGGAQAPVPLDVLFLLDATGSMGDEIDRLKLTIDEVAQRVGAFEVRPDVRFAFTLYRDEGDIFVTSSFDFTSDVEVFRSALAAVVADGGGDYPEALEEGLAAALAEPAWRDPASTVQLVFLVADAPPRLDRQVPVDYPASIVDAIARGIKVFPIASSESDDQAEAVFRQLALATGAPFVFLSYGASGAATGPATDIDSTDYEELALDDLVVRLIAEELAALTGTEPATTTDPSTTVPDTNPPGQ